jgi:DNA-binding MarR family transcriptional regulator
VRAPDRKRVRVTKSVKPAAAPRARRDRTLESDVRPVMADPVMLAQRILDDRNRRHDLFPGVRLGEPSWDMMLHLYVADHHRETRSVSDMCIAANVPTTTALSHIGRLVRLGYMARLRDEADRRRTFIMATDKLRAAVNDWLTWHRAWLSQLIQ